MVLYYTSRNNVIYDSFPILFTIISKSRGPNLSNDTKFIELLGVEDTQCVDKVNNSYFIFSIVWVCSHKKGLQMETNRA